MSGIGIEKEAQKRLRPYPAYKDSGVEWLGKIPAGWEVLRADAFLRHEKVQIEPSSISEELVFHYSIPSFQDTGDGVLEPPSEIDSAKLRILGERLLVSKLDPRGSQPLCAPQPEAISALRSRTSSRYGTASRATPSKAPSPLSSTGRRRGSMRWWRGRSG